MSPALPLLRDGVFKEEHRRIHQRLVRIQKFAAADAGFPSVMSALVACIDEIDALLPELVEHFVREEKALAGKPRPERPTEYDQKAEQIISEHQPLLRELRALSESGRRVIEDLKAGRDAGSMAEALKAYLTACTQDILEHEERERLFMSWDSDTVSSDS